MLPLIFYYYYYFQEFALLYSRDLDIVKLAYSRLSKIYSHNHIAYITLAASSFLFQHYQPVLSFLQEKAVMQSQDSIPNRFLFIAIPPTTHVLDIYSPYQGKYIPAYPLQGPMLKGIYQNLVVSINGMAYINLCELLVTRPTGIHHG